MRKKFKYRLDRRARTTTLSIAGAVLLVAGGLWLFAPGSYLAAWFVSVTAAAGGLCALSIPRSIRLTDEAVEISCLIEITHIPYDHIASVRPVMRDELRPFVPLFASLGFGGWFGYFLDVRGWDVVKVYTSSWEWLVMIEDIYEQRFLVNVDRPDELSDAIGAHMAVTPEPDSDSEEKPAPDSEEKAESDSGEKTAPKAEAKATQKSEAKATRKPRPKSERAKSQLTKSEPKLF
ncbi:MAG: hypothetical protein LBV18_06620 [Alistipes sp.]|jgi:hypothetical protein|nr:hypothetical protein [Alistipes sp.]